MVMKPIEFYEEQEFELATRQFRYSQQLFDSGVVTEVIFGFSDEARSSPIATDEITNPDMTDFELHGNYHFVPKLDIKLQEDDIYPVLYLAFLGRWSDVQPKPPIHLGRIDRTWTLVYPPENISGINVDMVLEFARDLNQARDSGMLPDLRIDFLSIDNPYHSLRQSDTEIPRSDPV